MIENRAFYSFSPLVNYVFSPGWCGFLAFLFLLQIINSTLNPYSKVVVLYGDFRRSDRIFAYFGEIGGTFLSLSLLHLTRGPCFSIKVSIKALMSVFLQIFPRNGLFFVCHILRTGAQMPTAILFALFFNTSPLQRERKYEYIYKVIENQF